MKLRLAEKRPEAGDATTFIFEPERPLSWQAGQYLEYHLPHPDADDRGIKRWFTISAAPFEARPQITTRLMEKPSTFKTALQRLAIGDEIEAGEPEGDFVLQDPSLDLVFIAGGIGITPYRSILKQAEHDGLKPNVHLLYGSRDQASTVFYDELEALARLNPNLKLEFVYEPARIDGQLIQALPDFGSKTFYVSGPEPMVEAFEKLLGELGIPEDQQRRDYFPGYEWPGIS